MRKKAKEILAKARANIERVAAKHPDRVAFSGAWMESPSDAIPRDGKAALAEPASAADARYANRWRSGRCSFVAGEPGVSGRTCFSGSSNRD
jgi:hypothetical protein